LVLYDSKWRQKTHVRKRLITSFDSNVFPEQNTPKDVLIPSDAEVVFVSDMFLEEYVGGAELSSEALIDSAPFNVFKVKSNQISMKTLESGHQKFWVFCNFASIDFDLIPTIVSNIKYAIVEYDYKYCKYRSPEKHKLSENKPCDCHEQPYGKMVSAFFYGARSLWWMSEKQQSHYNKLFPFLKDRPSIVLSSIFDDNFFLRIKELRLESKNQEREGYVVVGSNSWIKGLQDSIAYCEENSLDYQVVWNVPYDELLTTLSKSKGLVFLPKGGDTCPRLVIEAKLLGCELHLNENVQHKDEIWFDTDDMYDTEAYLYAARHRFWQAIKSNMFYNPTLSGYTTTLNCIDQDYPFEESISSLLGFCDEVVVVDGGSTDGTWEKLEKIARQNENIVIHQQKRDWDSKRFAVFDGLQKALARSLCNMDYCWQQDVDEIVHESDYVKVRDLLKNITTSIDLLCLPVVEYWGGTEKVRVDVNPWKWRLSKNLPHITHGIPDKLRKFDEEGNLYSAPGTDGCDYVRNNDYTTIKFSTFYTQEVENVRRSCMVSSKAVENYEKWVNLMVSSLPTVHHYSWFNIERKIKTYKNYWQKHWESLYDIKQEDTPENNMFFNTAWSDVSDSDISEMAKKLSSEMGGWVFHSKVDFDKPTPHIKIESNHPESMKSWIERNTGK
jgi:glycosyltransferase involved in cell wall biosynthesis